jgi:frataxin
LEDSHGLECELESGVLSLIMPDDKEYVINKHAPSKQIWVSSPYSGAGYFEYNGQNWVPKRSEAAKGRTLFEFIKDEVLQHLS